MRSICVTLSETALSLTLALLLVACGGGGGDDPGYAYDPLVTGGQSGNAPPIGESPRYEPPDEILFRILGQGGMSRFDTPRHEVARNQAELEALWDAHTWPGIGGPPPSPPTVEWGTEMAVAIFLGYRNSGGYGIEPVSTTAVGDGIELVYNEIYPGDNCMVTGSITHPWMFLAVTAVPGSVTFTKQMKEFYCPPVR